MANPTATTSYTVTASSVGCTATDVVVITVNPLPAITVASVSYCTGGSAPLTATGTSTAYAWAPATGLSSTIGATVTANPVSSTTYTVTGTIMATGCTATSTVTVTVNPLPSASTNPTNATCFGSCDGSATVTVTGGTAPFNYSWAVTSPVQTTATAASLCAGTYTVTVTDGNVCSATSTVIITQPTAVVVTPSANVTICIGQSTTLSATASGGTGPYTFNWNPGGLTGSPVSVSPAITATYTVVATDANGCVSAPKAVTVTVNPPLSVVASGTASVCPGDSKSISAVGSGGNGGPYTYLWSPTAGLSNPNIPNPVATPTATTTYVVTLTDGCTTGNVKDSVTITLNPIPVVSFVPDTTNGCPPVCVNFTDVTTIATGTITQWSWNFSNAPGSSVQNPTKCFNTTGVYEVTLTATSDKGCKAISAPIDITVFPVPVAEFTYGPQPTTIYDPEICFTNQSNGAVTWDWDFGDPLDTIGDSEANPCHKYSDTGTYCVNLNISNINGCVSSIMHCLVIEPFFTFYIPNAFTPNGDEVNDMFSGKGTYFTDYEMWVFDRWGNMIFYTNDINKRWDGKANGGSEIAQQDVYVYKVKLKDTFGKNHKYIGHVSLVK